jgi:hypothetical protein
MKCFIVFLEKTSFLFTLSIFFLLSSGCGNQGDNNGSSSSKSNPIVISEIADKSISYQIGGSVQGLQAGNSVQLSNAHEIINVTADASGKATFVFQNRVAPLGSYDITIVPGSTPAGMTCSLGTDASGTGINKDVTTASIACSKFTFSVGGRVSGLEAGLQLTLKEPNNDALTISANGIFSFPRPLAYNSIVSVSVDAQPTGSVCSVSIPTTTVTNSVMDITVTCARTSYKVSGTVSGLTLGQSVTVKNNGSDAQTVTYSASGPSSFSFTSPIAIGGAYKVSIATQPASQKCIVTNASGNIGASDISNVLLQCADPTYTVSTFVNLGFIRPRYSRLVKLALDPSNNIYAVDGETGTIKKVTPGGVVTDFAGNGIWLNQDNGPALSAGFNELSGLVFDKSGNAYTTEFENSKVRKIDTNGIVSTFAGSASMGIKDGDIASATFIHNAEIAIDANGNLYVADGYHNASIVRKIDVSTRTISTIAGNLDLVKGYVNGYGANVRFGLFMSMIADSSGNLYVADADNHVIRKIASNGEVSTFAGRGPAQPGDADGTGTMAAFTRPYSIAIDASGNLFVVDNNNKIKRITPYGVVTTIAGNGTSGTTNGLGKDASFKGLLALTIDNLGNIYVSESFTNNIRKLTPN